MKNLSIKTKVIVVLIGSLTIGAVALIALVRNSYTKNVAIVATSALQSAQKTFDNLKDQDLQSLTLASAAIANSDAVRELFTRQDRDGLYAFMRPTYDELKQAGLGFLLFLGPDGTVFLRMHAPQNFGDSLRQAPNFKHALETQQTSVGVQMAKPGLVAETCRPFRDKAGAIIGYVIVSKAFERFLTAMKSQTSDDYVLVARKSFLDETLYRKSQKAKGLPDQWDQLKDVVILGQTVAADSSGRYETALEGLSTQGKLLGELEANGNTYIRGVFLLDDPSGRPAGGIFVRHDISALRRGMETVQTTAVFAIVALMVLLSMAIAAVLSRLVFSRLKRTMDVATRVVGGEFSRQIVPASNDEVGQLEMLFEQFRTIFVGVVDDLSQAQARDDKKSA
jgi:methyl-accepting chemotaxis protein